MRPHEIVKLDDLHRGGGVRRRHNEYVNLLLDLSAQPFLRSQTGAHSHHDERDVMVFGGLDNGRRRIRCLHDLFDRNAGLLASLAKHI